MNWFSIIIIIVISIINKHEFNLWWIEEILNKLLQVNL